MKRFHNKKRNTALLYEFLIKHITNCLIENKKKEANVATALSKKYFSKGSLLHEELKLFNILLNTNVQFKDSAQKILKKVSQSSIKLNARKLNNEKSNLIKEINHNFAAKKFWSHKIPNYVIYASVHTLLSEVREKNKNLDNITKIKLEDVILEHLANKDKKVPSKQEMTTNKDYNDVVCKLVLEKFHKKYKLLSEQQRDFLINYTLYLISGKKEKIQSIITEKVQTVRDKLVNVRDLKLLKDPELMKNINECYKKLAVTDFDNFSEENIIELLRYIELTEEIESNDEKEG